MRRAIGAAMARAKREIPHYYLADEIILDTALAWLERVAVRLDDRRVERFDATIAGRPQLISGRKQLIYGSMSRLTEATVLNVKNVSHAVAADIGQHRARAGPAADGRDGKQRCAHRPSDSKYRSAV